MRFLDDPPTAWCVYEWATGTCWRVTADAAPTAKREAALAGVGHAAMRLDKARDLANAFAHGRMYGHQQAREQADYARSHADVAG